MEELISVIIPVYNVESYLARCLDSVIQNSYKNLEIICVNDGSTDNCDKILNEYSIKDKRIKVITKENGGLSSARNAGLACCRGTFICFVDSDDWIHPLYFEILIKFQKKYNSDIVICDPKRVKQKEIFDEIIINDITSKELNLEEIYADNSIKSYVWGRLYRYETIKDFLFPENIILEDAIYNAIVMCKTIPLNVVYIAVPLYFYFCRPDSLVHQIDGLELVKLSELYLKCSIEEKNSFPQKILTIETIKRTLFARYVLMITVKNSPVINKCNSLLKESMKILNKLDCVSKKDRIKYTVLSKIPLTYRLFRIISDPTMLDWEKQQKRIKDKN